MNEKIDNFQVYPIGYVRRSGNETLLEILPPYREALKTLGYYSHVMVFWWFTRFDNAENRNIMTCEPPYAPGHLTGMFACRSPQRPNPIAMTTCKVIAVDEAKGIVKVGNLDAFDGTPLLDLKAYYPVCDRVQNAHIPEWLEGWPEWMPEDGIGLEEGEA